jgi:uncharacterized protein
MPHIVETPDPPPTLRVDRLDGFFSRLRGLLGRPCPAPGDAVWLVPCRQVHSFGMRYAIDVVHLDAAGTVVAVETLKPWRLSRYVARAHSVLELKAFEAGRLGFSVGTRPTLIEESPRATREGPLS